MDDALIGYSGFVGATLLKQRRFEKLYRSSNIADIESATFNTVVCAGAPAQKWIANREPGADRENIDRLIKHLRTVKCERFILISTVDVFKNASKVDEDSDVDESDLHPYGKNRRLLEKFVGTHFPKSTIVRLPGLVGPGLRKNAIFDFLNENNLQAIDSRGIFQFYPMVNLWSDIQTAVLANLSLIHLTAEPVNVGEISEKAFGRGFHNELNGQPAVYDMQTRHADLFGASGKYQYSNRETMLAIRAYAQSESPATGA